MSSVALDQTVAVGLANATMSQTTFDTLNPFAYTHPTTYSTHTLPTPAETTTGDSIKRTARYINLADFFACPDLSSAGPFFTSFLYRDLPFAFRPPCGTAAPPSTPRLETPAHITHHGPVAPRGRVTEVDEVGSPVPAYAAVETGEVAPRAQPRQRGSVGSFDSVITNRSTDTTSTSTSGATETVITPPNASLFVTPAGAVDALHFGKKHSKSRSWTATQWINRRGWVGYDKHGEASGAAGEGDRFAVGVDEGSVEVTAHADARGSDADNAAIQQ